MYIVYIRDLLRKSKVYYFVIHYTYFHYTRVPTFVYIVYYQGYVSYIKVYFFVIHFCCPLNPHLCILCTISGICSTDEIEWNRNGDGVIDFYPLHFLFPASREINLFFIFWNITKKTRLLIDLVLQSVNGFDCMHISNANETNFVFTYSHIVTPFLLSCQSHWVSLS